MQALQVMGYLARSSRQRPVKLEKVSVDTGIPRHAVVKVVQAMRKQHLLSTSRGSRGGVVLAKLPGAITLGEIVCSVDGPPNECPVSSGAANCLPKTDCPIFRQWEVLAREVHALHACYDLQNFAEQNISISFYN